MALKSDYQKWLSLGFLRSKAVMSTMHRLSLGNFNPSEKALMTIFKLGKDWYDAQRNPVPLEYVQNLATAEILPKGVLNESEFETFVELLEFCYGKCNSPIEQLEGYVQDVITTFIEERQVLPMVEQLRNTNNLADAIEQMRKTMQRANIVKADPIDPFSSLMPLVCGEKKVRWNCDFIDSITGGAVRGETTLMLAPSGGGKTLSNIQIACSSALAGENAVILSYEQTVVPGLTNRVYSYVLGKRVDFFQGISDQEIARHLASDKALNDLWRSRREKLSGKLHMFDMMELMKKGGAAGGVEEIRTCIKQLQDQGKAPRYVGLDWFGPFIDNYLSSSKFSGKKSLSQKYEIMNHAANELRIMGSDLGINLFIYHQLGTQAAAKRPIDMPQAIDAYECRTLHHYMDTVICVGNRTIGNNLAYVHVPKHRNGEPNLKACIQMDGAHSRWKYISDKVVDDGNGGLLIPGSLESFEDADSPEISNSNRVRATRAMEAMKSPSITGFLG